VSCRHFVQYAPGASGDIRATFPSMQKTRLGQTAEEIPVVGFGGMPLSIDGRPPEAQARQVLHAAIDAGMTLIDTADVYCLDDSDTGHNERLIADVLEERADRNEILVATKAGMRRPRGAWTSDGSPEQIRRACEQSLRSLRADQVFLYQFHVPDPKVPFERSVETFARLRREGKFRWFGLSNVSIAQIQRAMEILPVVSVQNRLSPYFRESLDVAAECARLGITFLAYSPLGGGRLAKKLDRFDPLKEIAGAHATSVHAVVLAWVRSRGTTVVPIPGARTVEHAVDSARSAELMLSASELATIDAAELDRS
jgi:aryl-alcohol dehydrogenase-like predicted oxidoreductase